MPPSRLRDSAEGSTMSPGMSSGSGMLTDSPVSGAFASSSRSMVTKAAALSVSILDVDRLAIAIRLKVRGARRPSDSNS